MKKFSFCFISAFILLIGIIMVIPFFQYTSIFTEVRGPSPGIDFTSRITGTDYKVRITGRDYEVRIPNSTDPAEFCVESGEHEVHIVALSYFYIRQDDMVFHGVCKDI